MRRVWGMLALRSVLPFGLLLLTTLVYKLSGSQAAIAESSAWWLWFVTIVNVLCILLMNRFAHKEGLQLKDIFFFRPATWKKDLPWFLIAAAGSALFAMLPGNLLARALWGDPNYATSMLIRPLPLWAIYPLFLLMPVTQGLAELPIYWGYVAPRLRASGVRRWVVIVVVGLVLSLQHLFFSFQLDWRYDLWLAVKFLPFALWTGYMIDRRPTILPYMMALHLLLDASLPVLTLLVSQGMRIF